MALIDKNRPFLEIIEESAQKQKIYPGRIVEQFKAIDRAHFIPPHLEYFRDRIYTNHGTGGLLSEPFVIFVMVASLSLRGHEIILEGGTGVGYQTAILAGLCKHVYSIEANPGRAAFARERLEKLGIRNVTILEGDAAQGLPEHAPFDRGIFGCAIHGEVDSHLLDQMASNSRIAIPTGSYVKERGIVLGDLLYADKRKDEVTQRRSPIFNGTLYFVPLVSPRPIGWTWQKQKKRFIPSDQVTQRKWWQIWRTS